MSMLKLYLKNRKNIYKLIRIIFLQTKTMLNNIINN